jgi:glycosyltransferase involved in cell wall biosynthesis
VVVPVGPESHHAAYIDVCLRSIDEQDWPYTVVVLVDDMHGSIWAAQPEVPFITYEPPWRLGVAGAFNAGVAVALGTPWRMHDWATPDLALMLGADDWLEPGALSALAATYENNLGADGFYWFAIRYVGDEREDKEQGLPCNFAAVTRDFWRETGGFSPEMGAGQMDAALVSALLVHKSESLIRVPDGPWCNIRVHSDQQGRQVPPGLIEIRDWVTRTYKATNWGRYG